MSDTYFVAVAVCNFDDVLLGVWPSKELAKALACAESVAKCPEERQVFDTVFVHSCVYMVTDNTKIREYRRFEPSGRRGRKQTATA